MFWRHCQIFTCTVLNLLITYGPLYGSVRWQFEHEVNWTCLLETQTLTSLRELCPILVFVLFYIYYHIPREVLLERSERRTRARPKTPRVPPIPPNSQVSVPSHSSQGVPAVSRIHFTVQRSASVPLSEEQVQFPLGSTDLQSFPAKGLVWTWRSPIGCLVPHCTQMSANQAVAALPS